jgi:biotin carboxylase
MKSAGLPVIYRNAHIFREPAGHNSSFAEIFSAGRKRERSILRMEAALAELKTLSVPLSISDPFPHRK